MDSYITRRLSEFGDEYIILVLHLAFLVDAWGDLPCSDCCDRIPKRDLLR